MLLSRTSPTGGIRRRVQLRLHDKDALAKHLGLLIERHVLEGTVEHIDAQLTPAERIERVRQLQEKARTLPQYEAAPKTIDGAAQQVDEEHG